MYNLKHICIVTFIFLVSNLKWKCILDLSGKGSLVMHFSTDDSLDPSVKRARVVPRAKL